MNTVAGLEDATPLGLLEKRSRLARGGVCRCGGNGKLGSERLDAERDSGVGMVPGNPDWPGAASWDNSRSGAGFTRISRMDAN